MEKTCKKISFETEGLAYDFINQWKETALPNTDNTPPEFAHFCVNCRMWHVSTNKGTVSKEKYDALLVENEALLKIFETMQKSGQLTDKSVSFSKKLSFQFLKNKKMKEDILELEKKVYFQENVRKTHAGIDWYILENEKIQNELNWYKSAWKLEKRTAEELAERQILNESSISFFRKAFNKPSKKAKDFTFEDIFWYDEK